MKNTIYSFIILLALISCEKKFPNGHVTVYAYDVLSGQGLEGVHVSVSKIPNGDLGNSKLAGEGYTDANGNLEFNFRRYKVSKSWFIGHSFDNDDYFEVDVIESGNYYKEINLEIKYVPLTNYKIHLKNVNCYNANDVLFLDQIYSQTGDTVHVKEGVVGVGLVNYTGCFDELQTDFLKEPAGNYRYVGRIERENGTTYIDTTIFVQPGQDNLIELFF